MPIKNRQQIEALDGGRWISEALADLEDRFSTLLGLAEGVKQPYARSGVLMTDRTGRPDFSRIPWVDVPYDLGHYTASAGTWTPTASDVKAFRYFVLAGVLFLNVRIIGATTSAGMGKILKIQIPGGWRVLVASQYLGEVQWNATGVDGLGRATGGAAPNDHLINIVRDVLASSTDWPSGETNTLSMGLNMTIPVYHPTLRPLASLELLT